MVQVRVKPDIIYPALSAATESLDIQLHAGFAAYGTVTSFLDSKANVFSVAQNLAPRSAYTGWFEKWRKFSENVETYLLAFLNINSLNFFVGPRKFVSRENL